MSSIFRGKHYIHILSPIIIENLLTHDLKLSVWCSDDDKKAEAQFTATVDQSDRHQLFFRPSCQDLAIAIQFGEYNESDRVHLVENRSDKEFPDIYLLDRYQRPLLIPTKKDVDKYGREVVMIYASYWMVNKTGMQLFYKRKALRGFAHGSLAPGQESKRQIEHVSTLKELDVCTADQYDWYENDDERNGIGKGQKPVMFSYTDREIAKPRTALKVNGSEWSKPIGLESIGTSGDVQLDDQRTSVRYCLGVSIELLSERYFRTKVITIRPRFILVNRLSRDVYYTQAGTDFAHVLRADQTLPFHWLDRDQPEKISITFSPHHTWSGGFAINEIGEFVVKIRSKESMNVAEYANSATLNYGNTYLARVEVQIQKATFFVIFKKQASNVPPYSLENYTSLDIHYHQKVASAEPQVLGAYSAVPYTWDQVDGVHKLVIDIPKLHYRKIVKMDKIQSSKMEKISVTVDGEQVNFIGQILVRGPTRILRIYQESQESAQGGPHQIRFNKSEEDLSPLVTFQVNLNFAGLGLSLINQRPQELLYFSCLGLQLEYANSERYQSYEVTLDDVQLDNQLDNAMIPVLLSRTKKFDDEGIYIENKCVHFAVIMSNFYTTINYFHYVSFLLQEMDIRVDDLIINDLLDFFGWEIGAIHPTNFKSKNVDLILEPEEEYRQVYIALMHINPLRCNLTLRYAGMTENHREQENQRNHVKEYLSTVRATVSNIEGAPISLDSLLLEDIFNTLPELTSRVSKHYTQEILYDIHKIIGSFDAIGNPVNLVTNMGTGVHDFFYEPIHGLVISPKDFISGLQKGSSSLARNSASGIFNTISSLIGTLSRGVAHLTFDEEYLQERHSAIHDAPKNPASGFAKGLKGLGKGFYKGTTGLVKTPLNSARDGGVAGLIKGTGKGLAGAVVKPTVGFIDIAVKTTQGFKNATSYEQTFSRVRPPRGFGPDLSVEQYNVDVAIGSMLLWSVSSGMYRRDAYIFHSYLRNPGMVITSNRNVLYLDCRQDTPTVRWHSSLLAIQEVKTLRNTVMLEYFKSESSGPASFLGKDQRYLSMVQFDFEDTDSCRFFYEKLHAIIAHVHRFNIHQTDMIFSNKFIM